MGKKILGQEPAFIVGVVEAALAVFLTFGVLGLDQEEAGVIVATVSALLGLVVAYATSTTVYSAFVGFAKAILVLCVTFGVTLTDAQTGAIMALISLVAGAYLRGRTDSLDTAISSASPGAKKEALELFALEAAVIKAAEADATGVDATIKVVQGEGDA
jgi:hypothetical protein